jgi:hypothetical protein
LHFQANKRGEKIAVANDRQFATAYKNSMKEARVFPAGEVFEGLMNNEVGLCPNE